MHTMKSMIKKKQAYIIMLMLQLQIFHKLDEHTKYLL